MRYLFLKIILVTYIVGLVGCSSMNSSFDCPNKAGVNCRSLDEINQMVNEGQLMGRSHPIKIKDKKSSSDFDCYSTAHFLENHPLINRPLRSYDRVAKIWITPYEDSEGNYHQAHMMYTVIKKSHWIYVNKDRG